MNRPVIAPVIIQFGKCLCRIIKFNTSHAARLFTVGDSGAMLFTVINLILDGELGFGNVKITFWVFIAFLNCLIKFN